MDVQISFILGTAVLDLNGEKLVGWGKSPRSFPTPSGFRGSETGIKVER